MIMDLASIVEIINTIGFPIAACIALFWNNRDQSKHYREIIKEFKVSIDSNTDAVNRIVQRNK